jgi:hypothetical protein
VSPAVPEAELLELTEKLCRIPEWAKDFQRSAEWAWLRLRIRVEWLEFMAAHGLPTREVRGKARFDWHDILNVAMQLGQGPVARAARRFWPVALRRAEGLRPHYQVEYQTRCPEPGHPGDCRYVLALPDGEFVTQTIAPGDDRPGTLIEVSPQVDYPEVPVALRTALDVSRDLEFMLLPEKIRRDTGFLLASRLADCAGVAVLLSEELTARNIPARTSYGFIVTPPFAVEHYWAEVAVDGVWVPVDPVLIRTMVRWGVLDGAVWHPYRSIGPILARVGPEGVPTVTHNGVATPFTMPTRLLPDGAT